MEKNGIVRLIRAIENKSGEPCKICGGLVLASDFEWHCQDCGAYGLTIKK